MIKIIYFCIVISRTVYEAGFCRNWGSNGSFQQRRIICFSWSRVCRCLWFVVVHCIFWSLWLERSNRIFNDLAETNDEVWEKVKFRVAIWTTKLKEFNHLLISDVMYSSGNPSNITNPINDASFQFNIKINDASFQFQTTLCKRIAWDHVNVTGDLDPQYYLSSYNVNDIQLICCQADASTLWFVPDVVQKQFIQSLSNTVDMKYYWVLTRDRPKGKETVKYEKNVDPSDLPKASEVEGVLNGSFSSFRVHNIYPRFFRVTGSGEVKPFEQEVNDVTADLVLLHGTSEWWSFHVINSFNTSSCRGLLGPMAIIVSE